MKFTKAMSGLMSMAALTAVAASAAMATTPGEFDFTTVFSPNPITTTGGTGFGNYITVLNNSAVNQYTPSQITLANFIESSSTPMPGSNLVNTNFDVALTVTPNGGSSMTKHFLGNISGSFNNGISNLTETTTTPSLTYDFGDLGSYTFDTVTFVAPGITTSTVPGSLGATVNYSAVPEPATVAPFVLGSLGLMGLAFRARKAKNVNRVTA